MSLSALRGIEQSRRDDMYSFMFSMMYLRSGIKFSYNEKKTCPLKELCKLSLTEKFYNAFKMIEELKYDEKPQYEMMAFHFKKVLLDKELIPSIMNYDWAKNHRVREINYYRQHDETFVSLDEYI